MVVLEVIEGAQWHEMGETISVKCTTLIQSLFYFSFKKQLY